MQQLPVIQSNWDLQQYFTGSMLDEYAIRDLEDDGLWCTFFFIYIYMHQSYRLTLPDLSEAVRGPEGILKDKYVVG